MSLCYQPEESTNTQENVGLKVFELPIPIRNNLIVKVSNLPQNLTEKEAQRISQIIAAYAMFDVIEDDE